MYETLQRIINELNAQELEEIFNVNNLTIPGFRTGGPSNPMKVKVMKETLGKRLKLESYIKETATYYKEKKNQDYSWAESPELSIKEVQKKLQELRLSEVLYALAYENKLNLLKSIYENAKEETKEIPNKEKSAALLEITILNLRKIITQLENERDVLDGKLIESRNEIKILTKEKEDLSSQMQSKVKNLLKIQKEYDELSNLYTEEKEKLNAAKQQELELLNDKERLSKLLLEQERLQLLVFGKSYHYNYIKREMCMIQQINIDYISNIAELKEYESKQKLIVLNFCLNRVEKMQLQENVTYRYFNDLHKVITFETIEELKEYIGKVRHYYE